MGEHGLVSKTGFEEGSARVPLIISGPAAPVASGHRNASPVSLLDLFPTFLDLAGAEIPDYCQAASLLPIVRGETDSVHDAVFSEISRNDQFCYMVRDARWKWSIQAQNERLFDLQNDPHEMQNLAQSPAHADTAQRLRNRLLTFLTDTQLNHARGYKPLFTRIGMQFPTEDPADRKRIIRDRLRQVHQ